MAYTQKKHRGFQILAGLGAFAWPDNTTGTLQSGSKGDNVVYLQSLLNIQGATPPLAKDGVFGPRTRTAVVAFQQANKLTANGIVDLGVLTKLEDDNAVGIPKSGKPKDSTLPKTVGPVGPALKKQNPLLAAFNSLGKFKWLLVGSVALGTVAMAMATSKPKKKPSPEPVRLAIPA